jgi:hypothetical protein
MEIVVFSRNGVLIEKKIVAVARDLFGGTLWNKKNQNSK